MVRKIEDQLDYIGHVRVSVTGTLNVESQNVQSHIVDPKGTSVQPKSTKTQTTESNTPMSTGSDTGVLPNVGASIGGGGATGATSSISIEETQNQISESYKNLITTRPAGEFTAQQASVRLPWSYFASVLKQRGGGKDPSPSEVDAAIQAAIPSIKQTVKACANIKNADDVFVDTYYEISPTENTPAVAGISGSSSGLTAMVGGWGKELGVGVLALISLFMVSTMVKKSAPAPLVIQAPEKPSPATLVGGEEVAGLASEGGPALAGMELDDDTIQTQQILDQVQAMVGENPDAAANLVKRWLNRT
jgi:flagellar biosynthesis/type III secretory pathway M-ring protein FliF/YscJ